jgi:hypothetical protein
MATFPASIFPASIKHSKYTTTQLHNYTTTQLHNYTTTQLHNNKTPCEIGCQRNNEHRSAEDSHVSALEQVVLLYSGSNAKQPDTARSVRNCGRKTAYPGSSAFYDSLQQPSAIDANVPSNYARWKLGYGQGTPEHYVREEALFYFEDSQRPTNRQDSHTKRLKKKTLVIFIPKRCEMVGCDKTDIPTFGNITNSLQLNRPPPRRNPQDRSSPAIIRLIEELCLCA